MNHNEETALGWSVIDYLGGVAGGGGGGGLGLISSFMRFQPSPSPFNAVHNNWVIDWLVWRTHTSSMSHHRQEPSQRVGYDEINMRTQQ